MMIQLFILTEAICLCECPHTAYASQTGDGRYYTARDMTGREVVFDSDGYTRCAGPVRIVFDTTALAEGEELLYDDGSTLNPVENGEYVISAKEPDGEGVSFYLKDAAGELIRLNDRPLHPEITEGIYESPEACTEPDQEGYVIRVKPASYMHTYVRVKGAKNGILEEIDSETSISVHDDGEYYVEVYSEDGMGHRSYADIESRLVLDRQPPVMGETEEIPAVSKGPVRVKLTAYDEVSGVEGIYIRAGDGEAVRADTLELFPPFRGDVVCWAVDNMGNISDSICLGEDITADDRPPAVEISKADTDGKKLSVTYAAYDDISGIESVRIYEGKKCVYEGDRDKETVTLDMGGLIYGDRTYTLRAVDRAGNEASGSFTVSRQDGAAPAVELSGAEDRGIYGGNVDIRIDTSDDSGDRCSVKGTVTEYSLAGEYRGETVREPGGGEGPFVLHFDRSGVYIVRALASDEAGNTSSATLAFAIDREAPAINGLEGLEGRRLKSFMLDRKKDMVTDDSLVQYDIRLNGIRYEGNEITKKGRYRMQIHAVDEFGNTSSKDLSFTIADDEGKKS